MVQQNTVPAAPESTALIAPSLCVYAQNTLPAFLKVRHVYFNKESSEIMYTEDQGFELKTSCDKGEGIFASKSFHSGDTVMTGVIQETVSSNHSHASQVGENKY
ncbi:MAG: hypothetical protein D3903_15535, partial [Candidatus Electrothrix sp. GM3_4]|nr:hypothetical protein [Candidatus Electrothrix sp. GM3_4]